MGTEDQIRATMTSLVSDLSADQRRALQDELIRQDALAAQQAEQQTAELLADYYRRIEGVPRGQKGFDRRWVEIQKTRQKAAALGIPSPV